LPWSPFNIRRLPLPTARAASSVVAALHLLLVQILLPRLLLQAVALHLLLLQILLPRLLLQANAMHMLPQAMLRWLRSYAAFVLQLQSL
jgi:hypothetical protein